MSRFGGAAISISWRQWMSSMWNRQCINSPSRHPSLNVPSPSLLFTTPCCASYTIRRWKIPTEALIDLSQNPASVYQIVDWTQHWPTFPWSSVRQSRELSYRPEKLLWAAERCWTCAVLGDAAPGSSRSNCNACRQAENKSTRMSSLSTMNPGRMFDAYWQAGALP